MEGSTARLSENPLKIWRGKGENIACILYVRLVQVKNSTIIIHLDFDKADVK